MTAADTRWTAETKRLYRRYEMEVVEAYELCPWAAMVRRESRLCETVLLGSDTEDVGPSLAAIEALGDEIDLALLIYPRLGLERNAFDQFGSRVREAEVARRPLGSAPFVFAMFHPEAAADLETPERLIPFLRRTPDPTIQLLRTSALERVRGSISHGTQFVDARSIDMLQRQPPSLRERIARANHATALRVGVDALTARLDDIAEDRRATHRALESDTP